MSGYGFKNGQASVVLRLKVLNSASSVGAGLKSVASNASGLIISTITDVESTATVYGGASSVQDITTLGTYSAPSAGKCRWREVDSTNHPGTYELHFADARFAVSNAKTLLVSVSGAANMAEMDYVVPLQSDDPYVAKPTNYSVFSIDASGRVDLGKILGTAVDTTATQLGVRLNNITGSAVDTTSAQLGVRLNNISGSAVDTTSAQLGVRVIVNSDKTGYSVNSVTDKTGYALTAAYDAAKTAAQTGDAMALTGAYDFAKGTVSMTESYAANGAAPTPVQGMYAIHQMLMQFSISNTSVVVKKLDNATTAFVVTLSDSVTPTGATRT